MTKYVYVVAVYVNAVGKDKRILEDYVPDDLWLETDDFERAMNFYNSLDVEKVTREWLHPNEKNYCVKCEKHLARYVVDERCDFEEFDELLEFVTTSWMRLQDESKSITELVGLTDEERRYARV